MLVYPVRSELKIIEEVYRIRELLRYLHTSLLRYVTVPPT